MLKCFRQEVGGLFQGTVKDNTDDGSAGSIFLLSSLLTGLQHAASEFSLDRSTGVAVVGDGCGPRVAHLAGPDGRPIGSLSPDVGTGRDQPRLALSLRETSTTL